MYELWYGEQFDSYSTTLQPGFESIRLFVGRNGKGMGARPLIISFEMHGMPVNVTNQTACEKIIELVRLKNKDSLIPYLRSILFACLEETPEYLNQRLTAEYEKGVEAGKHIKMTQLRKALFE